MSECNRRAAGRCGGGAVGLWLGGRTLRSSKVSIRNDPSDWLDFARVMVTERPRVTQGTAGQLESFGFVLFASALGERDPALQQAITAHLASARMLDDPAALLMGRSEVTDVGGIAIEPASIATRRSHAPSSDCAPRATRALHLRRRSR